MVTKDYIKILIFFFYNDKEYASTGYKSGTVWKTDCYQRYCGFAYLGKTSGLSPKSVYTNNNGTYSYYSMSKPNSNDDREGFEQLWARNPLSLNYYYWEVTQKDIVGSDTCDTWDDCLDFQQNKSWNDRSFNKSPWSLAQNPSEKGKFYKKEEFENILWYYVSDAYKKGWDCLQWDRALTTGIQSDHVSATWQVTPYYKEIANFCIGYVHYKLKHNGSYQISSATDNNAQYTIPVYLSVSENSSN